MRRSVDVAVVGAGPAGVSAALAAAEQGASVALIDEGRSPGGRLAWSLRVSDCLPEEWIGLAGFQIARWAMNRLERSSVDYSPNAVAWGLFENNELTVSGESSSYQIRCGAIVVASGSTDITLPFPGWELPGVMTATAFLKALNIDRVIPGRTIAVVGKSDDAAEVIFSAHQAGLAVAATIHDQANLVASGSGRVDSIKIDGTTTSVDVIVLAAGRQPDPELAMQALAELGFSPLAGSFVPLRTPSLESSVPGVFIAGDAGGLCGVAEAFAEGRIAGMAAAGVRDLRLDIAHLAQLRSPARAREIPALTLKESSPEREGT